MLLIIFYKMGDAFFMALSTNFLHKLGFSLAAVRAINKTFGLFASILGTLYGRYVIYMAVMLCKKCPYLKRYSFSLFYRLFLISVIGCWQ